VHDDEVTEPSRLEVALDSTLEHRTRSPWRGAWALGLATIFAAGCTIGSFGVSDASAGDGGDGCTTYDGVAPGDAAPCPCGATCVASRPRQIAPLSTSRVTTRRPMLHWTVPDNAGATIIDVCSDRPCAHVIESLTVFGTSGHVSNDLPPGVVYWRARSALDATLVSPTWEFFVGHGNAAHDASWGAVPDFNGDGVGEMVIGDSSYNGSAGRAYVFMHNSAPGPLSTPPDQILESPLGNDVIEFGENFAAAGDVDGDGYGDLLVTALIAPPGGIVYLFSGGPSGVERMMFLRQFTTSMSAVGFGDGAATAGDVNGDGYADFVVPVSVAGYFELVFGGPRSTPWQSTELHPPMPMSYSVGGASGDFNGDGYGDILGGIWNNGAPPTE
jgi:hypothetical protein